MLGTTSPLAIQRSLPQLVWLVLSLLALMLLASYALAEETLPKEEAQTENAAAEENPPADTTNEPTAEAPQELPEIIQPTDYLLLPRVGDYRRGAFHIDPIENAIARGTWTHPELGDKVRSAKGIELAWQSEAKPPSDKLLRGGYAFTTFDSPAAGVMLIDTTGCAAVCLNGQWILGNPYSVSLPKQPVALLKGQNTLLLHLVVPASRPTFTRPTEAVTLAVGNAVVADLVGVNVATDKASTTWNIDTPLLVASVPIVNSGSEPLVNYQLIAQLGDDKSLKTTIDRLPPRSITLVPFKIRAYKGQAKSDQLKLSLQLTKRPTAEEALTPPFAEGTLSLKIVSPESLRTQTFASRIDGSIQRYAYLPATVDSEGDSAAHPTDDSEANATAGEPVDKASANEATADTENKTATTANKSQLVAASLIVNLHDVGEDPLELLRRSKPLSGVHQLAPLGRGLQGFDWEDWSARDVLEAMADLQSMIDIDPKQIAITGHGMGGHGAIWLATTHPERFAAVVPSEAWLNLLLPTDATLRDTTMRQLVKTLNRRAEAADLFALTPNLSNTTVRLHQTSAVGSVAQAEVRELRSQLGTFHADFAYQENSLNVIQRTEATAAALAVSSQRRNANHKTEDPLSEIDFITPDLLESSEQGWVKIESLIEQGGTGRVQLSRDIEKGTIDGSTENVRRMQITLSDANTTKNLHLRIDSREFLVERPTRANFIDIERDEEGTWALTQGTRRSVFGSSRKDADRPGGLKSVFRQNPLLVYGTQGNKDENAWAKAKAHYDADLFRYRGNGRLDLIADYEFSPREHRNRSLIFYGNMETNSACKRMFARSPVKVLNGLVQMGERPERGDDLAVLLVRPRLDSRSASMALIGGTGLTGMRMTTRLRYFWSGVHYPDLLIYGPNATAPESRKLPLNDVRAVGYFDTAWELQQEEIVWQDLAL